MRVTDIETWVFELDDLSIDDGSIDQDRPFRGFVSSFDENVAAVFLKKPKREFGDVFGGNLFPEQNCGFVEIRGSKCDVGKQLLLEISQTFLVEQGGTGTGAQDWIEDCRKITIFSNKSGNCLYIRPGGQHSNFYG